MRKLAIMAALASTTLATPALAVDNAWYVGVEGGAMIVEDANIDFKSDDLDVDDALQIDHNVGIDVDLIGGYDFGGFRVEAELGYKSASLDEMTVLGAFSGVGDVTGEVDGDARVLSAMLNGLLDFGEDGDWNGYIGGGVGLASVKYNIDDADPDISENDGTFAWQVIAGVRKAVSSNIELGLKYRFFNTTKFKFDDSDSDGRLQGKWRSHSLLASLIYNFAPPPPPPPPPPEPERG